MNWQRIQGKWQEYKGRIQQRWGKLTDNDLAVIRGEREQLAGKLRSAYGKTKEQAEAEIDAFEAACDDDDTEPKADGAAGSGCS